MRCYKSKMDESARGIVEIICNASPFLYIAIQIQQKIA